MKKNKTNKILILLTIFIILAVALVVFILNYTKDGVSLSIVEKSWINKNSNNVIDVNTYNDIPVYGYNGEGIIFSFLDKFTDLYGIEFNKVSYFNSDKSSLRDIAFKITDYNEQLTKEDVLMYEDEYVLVGKKDTTFNNLEDMRGINIGVFNDDMTSVSYYLFDSKNISYTPYDNINDLINAVNENVVDYIAIPNTMYIDYILGNNLNVAYHISELNKKYVLTVKNNKTLLSIMKKYYTIYNDNYYKIDYKENFLNIFFKAKKITEAEKMNYNSSAYNYGYVVNMPYENTVNNEFVGIISNYLQGFEDLTNIDFKITEYNSISDLKNALSRGELDIVFANYPTEGLNIDTLKTPSPLKEEYVVLSKETFIVNSIRTLKGKNINVVKDSYLNMYLNNNSIAVNVYNNTDELLRNSDNNSIIIMDYDTYNYYKEKKFSNFKIIYTNKLENDYTFVIRDVNKNQTFYQLFNYYVGTINYKNIRYNYNTNYVVKSLNTWSNLTKTLLMVMLITIALIVMLLIFLHRKSKKSNLKKEEKLKFIDVMTSLKNRNYLNYNMQKWEDNVIYPQAILIIDLNNIKYINDNHGHSEGDKVIIAAANTLINNQIENTDIVRTDGNEFLIYMVGYEENNVQEYIRKLSKELQALPYNFGATIGYSMIVDDVKTIDDAINEATILMREAKEKR